MSAADAAVLDEWNQTERVHSSRECAYQLFDRQADETPERVAVVCGDTRLSYRELQRRSDLLTRRLRAAGVTRGALVGLFLDRSIDAVSAMLAIGKAGAAFVPISPDYPAERVRYVVADTGMTVIITDAGHLSDLNGLDGVRVMCPGDVGVEPLAPALDLPPAAANDLAYVVYTSGSTGQPKGVLIEHAGLNNRLRWMQAFYALTAEDVLLHKTSLSFDVSIWEILFPLVSGARLVIAPPGSQHDVAKLVELVIHHGVTFIHFVPKVLELFLSHKSAPLCRSLRMVVCGGEAWDMHLGRRCLATLNVRLFNGYGPTESSIGATCWPFRPEAESVCIGRPIFNTKTYVVDRDLNRVAVGDSGELCISGVGLARGYLNRPELTASAFAPNPFNADGDPTYSRVYRTGDLARYTPSGDLEFLGRIDAQIKINGIRVEPGEIEAALRDAPEVGRAVVTYLAAESHLVAFVVLSPGWTGDAHALSDHLARRLPKHMIPSEYVFVPEIPLTVNGKIDYQDLLSRRPAAVPDSPGPADDVASFVAALWRRILGVTAALDRHRDYFSLGGNSIRVLEMIGEINRAYDVDVSLETFLKAPTLDTLTGAVRSALGSKDSAEPEAASPVLPYFIFVGRAPRPAFLKKVLADYCPGAAKPVSVSLRKLTGAGAGPGAAVRAAKRWMKSAFRAPARPFVSVAGLTLGRGQHILCIRLPEPTTILPTFDDVVARVTDPRRGTGRRPSLDYARFHRNQSRPDEAVLIDALERQATHLLEPATLPVAARNIAAKAGSSTPIAIARYFPNCLFGTLEAHIKKESGGRIGGIAKIYCNHTFEYSAPAGPLTFADNGVDLALSFSNEPLRRPVLLPRLEDYYGARVVETRYDDFGEWVSNVLDGIAAKRFVVSSFDLGFLNSRREYHRVYSPHFVYFFGWEGRDTTFLACEQTTGISRIPLYDLRDFHDHRRRRGEAVLLLGLDPRSPLKERPVKESELREQLERSRDNLRSSQDHLGLRALRRFARDIASFAAETPRPFAVPGLWVFSHDLYLLERYLATAVPEVGGHVEPRLMALIARLHQLWLSVDMRLENGLYNGDVSQTRAAVANMENIVSGEEELALALEAFIFTLHGRDRPTYPTPEAVPGAIP